MTSADLGPWLTAEEAAQYLGLPSRKAVYQRVRRGQLPAHRLGARGWRFLPMELDETLLTGRTPLEDRLSSNRRRPSAEKGG